MKSDMEPIPRTADITINRPFALDFLGRLTDVFVLLVTARIANYLRFGASLDSVPPNHKILVYFCITLAFFIFPKFTIYESWRGRFMLSMFSRIVGAWMLTLMLGMLFIFLIHLSADLSRSWLLLWGTTGAMALTAYRVVVYVGLNFARSKGYNQKRVVIVGYGQTGQVMLKRALAQGGSGYEVVAILADTYPESSNLPKIVRLESMESIPGFLTLNRIDEIWITLPVSASSQLHDLQYLLRNALVDIRWVPDMLGLQLLSKRMVNFLGVPTVDLNRPVSHGIRGTLKHVFDKMIALAALIMLSPLLIVIAACIKYTSPGPVFFKQVRLGLNGKQFMIYKFRSMALHDEQHRVTQATQGDPRITAIGRFLRRTSIDELPQFINVLLGDMSVVGPRPHALEHNEMYEEILELYMVRHRVKPGITGWAQIHGLRGETDTVDKMERRVQFDLHYIQNWSLQLDLRILLWSAIHGWVGKNAY